MGRAGKGESAFRSRPRPPDWVLTAPGRTAPPHRPSKCSTWPGPRRTPTSWPAWTHWSTSTTSTARNGTTTAIYGKRSMPGAPEHTPRCWLPAHRRTPLTASRVGDRVLLFRRRADRPRNPGAHGPGVGIRHERPAWATGHPALDRAAGATGTGGLSHRRSHRPHHGPHHHPRLPPGDGTSPPVPTPNSINRPRESACTTGSGPWCTADGPHTPIIPT